MTDDERSDVLKNLRLCVRAAKVLKFDPKVTNALRTAERTLRVLLFGDIRTQDIEWRYPAPVWEDGSRMSATSTKAGIRKVYGKLLGMLSFMRAASEMAYGDDAVYCNLRYTVELIEDVYDPNVEWEERT